MRKSLILGPLLGSSWAQNGSPNPTFSQKKHFPNGARTFSRSCRDLASQSPPEAPNSSFFDVSYILTSDFQDFGMFLAPKLEIAEGPEHQTQCRQRPKSSKELCKILHKSFQKINANERCSQNSDRHFAIHETPTAATNAEPHFAGTAVCAPLGA